MKSIYKNPEAKAEVHKLYYEKLKGIGVEYTEVDVPTQFGDTRVIRSGSPSSPKLVVFHGINAGAPVALEVIAELSDEYELICIDTIGQATMSAETRIDINGPDYGIWADEVVSGLGISSATYIGVSYGAFILQKVLSYRPDRVEKAIMIVPGGLVNGSFWPSFTRLSLPLMRYMMTKKDKHLRSFIAPFVPSDDDFMFRLQKALLLGVNIDFRRPGLLKKKDVEHYNRPVYIMVAEDDIFFPGHQAIERARAIFNNLKDSHVLRRSKHMPSKESYPELIGKIREWAGE